MLKFNKLNLKKNFEIFALIFLILSAALFTSYFNYKKKIDNKTYNNFIDNIYFQKTLKTLIENLEPKFEKIRHKIQSGETFDKILNDYNVDKKEIIKIKKSFSKKINLNQLKTKQTIEFTLDKTNNKIVDFTYQTSNFEKIFLKRNIQNDTFNETTLSIKLNKKIIYAENIILQSLYKAALDEKIPANTIIEFASIYGFQVDFQRDIRKQDKFQ